MLNIRLVSGRYQGNREFHFSKRLLRYTRNCKKFFFVNFWSIFVGSFSFSVTSHRNYFFQFFFEFYLIFRKDLKRRLKWALLFALSICVFFLLMKYLVGGKHLKVKEDVLNGDAFSTKAINEDFVKFKRT